MLLKVLCSKLYESKKVQFVIY